MQDTTGSRVTTVPATDIYTGVWVNWAKGPVYGSTLTLSSTHGLVFSSLLATFISIVAIQLWKLLVFGLYQFRASLEEKDALYHQHQAILRNAVEPSSAAWTFCQQIWYWRKHASRSFARSFPLVFTAVAFLAGFAAVSVFLPAYIVSSTGSQRLIASSNNCGFLNNSMASIDWAAIATVEAKAALSYTDNCYGMAEFQLPAECAVYQRPTLPWTATKHVPCPFKDGLCKEQGDHSIKMSTPLLDSNADLGINTPSNERIHYRTVSTCSPLVANSHYVKKHLGKQFEGGGYVDADVSKDTWLSYLYGVWQGCNLTNIDPLNPACSTHYFNTQFADPEILMGYTFTGIQALADAAYNDEHSFLPSPALQRNNADVGLFYLDFNAMRFEYPNDDPVFSAHRQYPLVNSSYPLTEFDGQYLIYPDQFVSTVACADQHQFCNPNNGQCTPLTGLTVVEKPAMEHIGLSRNQKAVFQRMYNRILSQSNMPVLAWELGAAMLDVSKYMSTNYGLQTNHIPSDQWEIEVQRWFSMSLASLQRVLYEYVTSTTPQKLSTELVGLNKTYEPLLKTLCGAQLTKAQHGTVSFSVLAISLVIGLGVFSVIGSIFASSITSGIRRRFHPASRWRSERWKLDDMLYLQRSTYINAARWKHRLFKIPLTEKGDKFKAWQVADLDLRNNSTFSQSSTEYASSVEFEDKTELLHEP